MNKQNFIDKNKPDYVYKVLILGDMCVGKTCMLLRYCDNVFNDNHISTIGVDYRVKSKLINNDNIKLQIWDTAGQDRFRAITRSYYKGSNGILLIFDVTNRDSFNNVKTWINQIVENVPTEAVIVLVANKIDSDERIIQTEEAEEFAKSKNLIYQECSAKLNKNVVECFDLLVNKIYETGSVESVSIKKKRLEDLNSNSGSNCCKKG